MSTLIDEFNERSEEVMTYLEFLSAMETEAQSGPPRFAGTDYRISVLQQRILYSSVYLQLYNLVESTISRCITAVAEATMRESVWKPGDLTISLRREWVRSIARTHQNLNPENRLDHALNLCDRLINALSIEQFKIEKGGGGNWDDDAIEEIGQRIGLNITVQQPIYTEVKRKFRNDLSALEFIKRLRNDLAHGDISFGQCAENESVENLSYLARTTISYLKEVIVCFTRYLDCFEFLIEERRP